MQFIEGLAVPESDGFMATELREGGRYQRGNLDAAMEFVKERHLAVDCGAHIGTWSLPLSDWFTRVVSFEPSPDTFEALAYNLREHHNVELHNVALGKSSGRVTMTLEGFDRAIAMRNVGARFTKEGGDIPRITLDSLNLTGVDFIKMDIEGGEMDAMLGGRKTIEKSRPVVLFEDKGYWRRYGHSRRAPHEFLASLGAKPLLRVKMDEIWGW